MTYLTFLLLFLAPPIAGLWISRKRVNPQRWPFFGWALGTICAIAFIYTTPWDNYLVFSGIWDYPADRVIARIGYVPLEEYAFFILQPVLTGLWLYLWLPEFRAQIAKTRAYRQRDRASRFLGSAFWMLALYFGLACLTVPWGRYLGLILVWASPMLAIQWLYGGHDLWNLRRLWIKGCLPPTLYLWVADRLAIAAGIWHFPSHGISGLTLFGLPIEEALFFLVTNLLVVQGLILSLIAVDRPGDRIGSWIRKQLRQYESRAHA